MHGYACGGASLNCLFGLKTRRVIESSKAKQSKILLNFDPLNFGVFMDIFVAEFAGYGKDS